MYRLPQLNFEPVIASYKPLPVEQLGETIGLLREDYNTGLATADKARQAMSTARATLPRDQEELNKANQEILQILNQAEESGDYENQVSSLKRAFSGYTANVNPIMTRNKVFSEYLDRAEKAGANRADVRRAMINDETLQSTLINEDGFLQNRLDVNKSDKYVAPGVDITAELSKYKNLFNEEISNLIGTPNAKIVPRKIGDSISYTLVTQDGQTRTIPLDQVKAVMDAVMKNESIQRYMGAQKELAKNQAYFEAIQSGMDNDFAIGAADKAAEIKEAEILAQSGPIANAIAYENNIKKESTQILGTTNPPTKPPKNKTPEELVYSVTNGEMFQAVSPDFSSIAGRISDLQNNRNPTVQDIEELNNLTALQESAFSQVEKKINIDEFYDTYSKIYKQYTDRLSQVNKDDFAEGQLKGTAIIPKKEFESKESFLNALRNPDQFNILTNNILTQLGNAISPTDRGVFQNQYNEYWDIMRQTQEKIKIAKSPMIISALSSGSYDNLIGGINLNMTETFKNNRGGFNLLLSGKNIQNTDHLREKYGKIDNDVTINERDFVLGRDPDRDEITIAGTTFNGNPVFQLTIKDENGETLGSELITGRSNDGIRQIRQVAKQIYQSDPDTALQILSNIDILPTLQSKNIYQGNNTKSLGNIKFNNPFTGKSEEAEGFSVKPNKDEQGEILGLELIDNENNSYGQFSSEEDISKYIMTLMITASQAQ